MGTRQWAVNRRRRQPTAVQNTERFALACLGPEQISDAAQNSLQAFWNLTKKRYQWHRCRVGSSLSHRCRHWERYAKLCETLLHDEWHVSSILERCDLVWIWISVAARASAFCSRPLNSANDMSSALWCSCSVITTRVFCRQRVQVARNVSNCSNCSFFYNCQLREVSLPKKF